MYFQWYSVGIKKWLQNHSCINIKFLEGRIFLNYYDLHMMNTPPHVEFSQKIRNKFLLQSPHSEKKMRLGSKMTKKNNERVKMIRNMIQKFQRFNASTNKSPGYSFQPTIIGPWTRGLHRGPKIPCGHRKTNVNA